MDQNSTDVGNYEHLMSAVQLRRRIVFCIRMYVNLHAHYKTIHKDIEEGRQPLLKKYEQKYYQGTCFFLELYEQQKIQYPLPEYQLSSKIIWC